jgi:tol-pal system protein YbgF
MRCAKGIFIAILFICLLQIPASGQDFLYRLAHPDAIGGNIVATHLDGLRESTSAGPGLEIFLKYQFSPRFFLAAGTGIQMIYDELFKADLIRTTLLPTVELRAGVGLTEESPFYPYIYGGLQAFGFKTSYPGTGIPSTDLYFDGSGFIGGGFELAVNDQISFNASGDYRYVFTATGDPKPKHWVAKAGITYALNPIIPEKREEIEYPLGENDFVLDDLFKDDYQYESSSEEDDALALLFQPEAESSDLSSMGLFEESETSPTYSNTEIGNLYVQIQDLKDQMEQRNQQIENLQNLVRENEKTLAEVTGRVAGESFGIISRESFKTNYEMALQKFYDRNYKDGIRIFRSLLTSYPDHRLASNCQYWIGECHNAMGDYRDAINAFNLVLNYKTSYKFDDALLMNGLVHLKMGDRTTARDNFQQLVNQFPESEYAPKAMRYLGRL